MTKESTAKTADAITLRIPKISFTGNYTPILIGLLIIASFLLGMLTTKVQYLEKNVAQGVQGAAAVNPQGGSQQAAGAQQPPAPGAKVDVAVGHLPVLGSKDAKVTIVEFSDFQCPFCERFWKETVPQIKKEYVDTGKARFAYRHFPLTTIHQNAAKAGEASECANDQGKFWEYHDSLFENQAAWANQTASDATATFVSLGERLGLTTQELKSCLDSGKHAKDVSDDETAGQQAGVNGTPATYINGQLVSGAQPYTAFKSLIDAALAK